MDKQASPEAIAKWAEADNAKRAAATNAGVPHLTRDEILDVVRWHRQGLTQQQIAARFNPPRAQSTISETIAKWTLDTTEDAKTIFRARAAEAAVKIMDEGLPRDLIAVQRGMGVLVDDSGLKLQIIQGVSLPGLPVQSEGLQIQAESIAGADNLRYVNDGK